MAEPPVLGGGVQRAIAVSAPPTAPCVGAPMTGGPGTVAPAVGVTVFEEAEKAPVPTLLVAATWKWYGVPFVSPVTTRLVVPAAEGRRTPTCCSAAFSTRTE